MARMEINENMIVGGSDISSARWSMAGMCVLARVTQI